LTSVPWHLASVIAVQRHVRSWVQTGSDGHSAKVSRLTRSGSGASLNDTPLTGYDAVCSGAVGAAMKRREFINFVGSTAAAAACPLPAWAQGDRIRRIGVLMGYADGDREGQTFVAALREGLRNLGWIEGRNIAIDLRWGTGSEEPTQRFAADIVSLKPDLIVSHSTVTTSAILAQTRTIPVVFANVTDPIGSGFVASLPHPGGNATGFINMEDTMSGKWLQLLKEVAPRTRKVAFLYNPKTAPYFHYYLNFLKTTAPAFGVEAVAAPVNDRSQLEPVMAAHAREDGSGMIVMTDNFNTANRVEIVELAARYRLPTVYPYRFFSNIGGLLSYGSSIPDNFRRAAGYVDRILKGASPNELPVQAPVKFDLVVNLKTARELGLEVPSQLQQRADEVIE
jgi:putative ABC transport system substrate-binding protein